MVYIFQIQPRNIPDTLLKAMVDIYTQNKMLMILTSNYQDWLKLIKECAKVALFCLRCLIYLDDITNKWQKKDIKGIPLPKNQQLLKLLMADDKVTISSTEDKLQKAAYKLSQIITEHILTTSVEKTKLMAFKGREPVGSTVVR
jgi:hypothetical protein